MEEERITSSDRRTPNGFTGVGIVFFVYLRYDLTAGKDRWRLGKTSTLLRCRQVG